MRELVAIVVFAGAAALAIGIIAAAGGPQWRRIVRLASGQIEAVPAATSAERWRAVHLAADRQRPFHVIRGTSPRRGLLDRLVRR